MEGGGGSCFRFSVVYTNTERERVATQVFGFLQEQERELRNRFLAICNIRERERERETL